jgi:type I restriction enzyme M protein
LLGGLEATEVRLKRLNAEFRIDAEYYKKDYLKEDQQRGKYPNTPLGHLAFITDGQHGYHEVDEESPITLLTAKNAKNWFADKDGADRVAKWVDEKNQRSSLHARDIIVSTRGSLGYCALITNEVLPANIDQDVARVAIESKQILPEFLLTYLNCVVGQDWIGRKQPEWFSRACLWQN